MKKAFAFAAIVAFSAATVAFTTKPVADVRHDNPLLEIVEKTIANAMALQPTYDPDHDFVHYIQALHKGGIQLSEMAIAKAHNPDVKTVAKEALDEINRNMAELNKYMETNAVQPDKAKDLAKDAHDDLEALSKKADNANLKGEIDHDYALLMARLADAERGIAKAYLKHGADVNLEALAKRLAEEKKEEKKDLKKEEADSRK